MGFFVIQAVYSGDKLCYTKEKKKRKWAMNMIRRAVKADLNAVLKVYKAAKAYMVASGNPAQWEEGYPECVLDRDIEKENLYVLCGRDGTVHAAFVFALGEEADYAVIEDGSWTGSAPYGTIHRLGSDGTERGVFTQCLDFCKAICPYIRADTHHDNRTMQHLFEKHGFVRRGIIHIYDGSPRIAYEFFA